MRIAFLGTPDFARASLKALLDDGRDIAAVFTQPDRPRGRGMRLAPSPVKELAEASGIPVYQPETFSDGAAAGILREVRPDLTVAVAYGRLLPEDFLSVPKLGSINLHGSLLPRWRGAAPIQWAILSGDRITGVTVQYMAKEMDAGDIISRRETEIGEFETSGELFDRLKDMGAELLVRTLRDIGTGTAPRRAQDHSRATYVHMLDKSLCPIDWNRSPREVLKWICGLQPWPVATMELEGKTYRVFDADYSDNRTDKAPGSVVSAGEQGIEIACSGGETLYVTELQAPGKKRMRAAEFLRGHVLRTD